MKDMLQPSALGFGRLFNQIRDAVIVADVDSGRIVLWNLGAMALFGYTVAEALELPLEALIPQKQRAQHQAGVARYRATGHGPLIDSSRPVEVPALQKTGTTIQVELMLSSIHGVQMSGRSVLASLRDVTERRHAEEVRREAEVLRRTEQLQSALLSSVSHDLRSPLASIKTSVTNLLDEGVHWQAAERRELLRTINEETDRLTRFVSRLLDLSRIEGHAVQPHRDWDDVEEILSGVVERLDPSGDHVLLQVPDDLPLAYLDCVMVEQICTNLVENALKYSPPGAPVEVTAHLRDEQLTIEIADRGPGIPPSEAAHIFEKFYRVSDHAAGAPGTGLGLAIARGLARAHDGEVHFTPRPGGGSIFTVSLPIAAMGRGLDQRERSSGADRRRRTADPPCLAGGGGQP